MKKTFEKLIDCPSNNEAALVIKLLMSGGEVGGANDGLVTQVATV